MKTKTTHLMSAIAVLFFIFIAFGSGDDDKTNANGTQMTERQKLVDSQFSSWDGSHNGLTNHIKEHMNDPDSYEHVETRFGDHGDYILVITKFRGTNAFGGKVINTITAKVDLKGNVIEVVSQE